MVDLGKLGPIKIDTTVKVEAAAVARPGDTLVVGIAQRMSDDDYTVLYEQFQPLINLGIKVAIADGVTAMVVIRPEGD